MREYVCKKCHGDLRLKITGTLDDIKCKLNSEGEAIIEQDDVEINVWYYECMNCGTISKNFNEIAFIIEKKVEAGKQLFDELSMVCRDIENRNYSKNEIVSSLKELLKEYKENSR